MMTAIIDYGSGNLRSVARAFERVVSKQDRIIVTAAPETIARADRIILPGVGAFGACRRGLMACEGLVEALETAVQEEGKPFLGICVGMQLLADTGYEYGPHIGLGWIPGSVTALTREDSGLKIPHMGWNELTFEGSHPLTRNLPRAAHAYFVHSYEFSCQNGADRLAYADYGGAVTAMIGRDNILGVQFHPEKSQQFGLCLIAQFLAWSP